MCPGTALASFDGIVPGATALGGLWLPALALGALVAGAVVAARRLPAALSTLRARSWTPALSRLLSARVRTRDYTGAAFFAADGAGAAWVERRRAALDRLAERLHARTPQARAWGAGIRDGLSDLRFTDANRVPFRFARVMRERFDLTGVVTETRGPRLRGLDDDWALDISGSYGVNVAGYERYKEWIAAAAARVRDVGPVLGPLHPLVAGNIAELRRLSGLDEVSFHASGTEAVMAAVRLARFNTGRRLIVCFAGAYHGWWDGVQPGLGSERGIDDCLTLKDLHPASLRAIHDRAGEIAAVLVNPVQSFHPNAPPPNDAVLLTSDVRTADESTERYAAWLRALRDTCTSAGVPLIFDEVYSGFRLAPGGAQEFFGVRADMVVYGKTVAGGLPIGAVCGTHALMRRFDPARPMRMAYVIGTFSAHPLVMAGMDEFLRWLREPETAARYASTRAQCAEWVRETNRALAAAALPLRIGHLGTIWTILFTEPGRYHWLLQYYLRAEGLALSWVGTGRCLISLDFEPADFAALRAALLAAARAMREDGWWLTDVEQPGRARTMRLRLARELLGSLVSVPRPLASFHAEVMQRKADDHHASHSNLINQIGHILSSTTFILCYGLLAWHYTAAMWIGLAALFVRQLGHAVFEPPCHDKEQLLLGFTTRAKSVLVAVYLLVPIAHLVGPSGPLLDRLVAGAPGIAWQWLLLTLAVVTGHVAHLAWTHDLRSGLIWLVKLATDPFTDLVAYVGPCLRALRQRLAPVPRPSEGR